MSKSRHPLYLSLRQLAWRIQNDRLCEAEKSLLANALYQMAEGMTFEQAIRAERRRGRPYGSNALNAVQYVATLMLPSSPDPYRELGGEGLTKSEAISRAAQQFNVSIDTIEKEYSTERGQALRAQVKEIAEGCEGFMQADPD